MKENGSGEVPPTKFNPSKKLETDSGLALN
jgi:hypothetical protein